MIKKEYIQPKVKEIKVNLPVVLAADSKEEPTWNPDVESDQEEDLG